MKNLRLTLWLLATCYLLLALNSLHPFMPFITEHIWSILRERKLVEDELLIVADWPKTLDLLEQLVSEASGYP